LVTVCFKDAFYIFCFWGQRLHVFFYRKTRVLCVFYSAVNMLLVYVEVTRSRCNYYSRRLNKLTREVKMNGDNDRAQFKPLPMFQIYAIYIICTNIKFRNILYTFANFRFMVTAIRKFHFRFRRMVPQYIYIYIYIYREREREREI